LEGKEARLVIVMNIKRRREREKEKSDGIEFWRIPGAYIERRIDSQIRACLISKEKLKKKEKKKNKRFRES